MGMFRYRAKVQLASSSLIGHGCAALNTSTFVQSSLTPAFDFYDGATRLFRLHGVSDQINKTTSPLRLLFDANLSSEVSHASPAWPASLDDVRIYRASDGAARCILSSSSVASLFSVTAEGFEKGGSTSRFAFLACIRDSDGSGGSSDGVVFVDGEELVFEYSGDFTHVETVYPWPAWAASTDYESTHIFTAMETGSQPKIYSPNGSVSGAVDFDTFAVSLTPSHEADAAGGQVYQVHTADKFNDTVGNLLQLKAALDADNDVILLNNETQHYLDTTAASNGTGRSRQSPYNILPALPDNTLVLVIAGSTVGETTFAADALLTVQNGVVGGSGVVRNRYILRYIG